MSNPSKQKGTTFETACVKLFTKAGLKASRLALSGNKDQGDVEVVLENDRCWVVECKCLKSWSRGDIEKWRQQAIVERQNYANTHLERVCYPCLIVSVHGSSNDNSYVHIMDNKGWIQMYMDEFIDRLIKSNNIAKGVFNAS